MSAVDKQEAVRDVLFGLRRVLDADDPSSALGSAEARSVIDQAWGALADVLGERADGVAVEILTALRQLRGLDRALVDAGVDAGVEQRSSEVSRRFGDVLATLESSPCSVSDLVELAPRLICELGFDRAIISHVAEGIWVSESVFVTNDPKWAADINRVGQEQPQQLVRGLFETEVVRRREPIVVTDVQCESRVHRPIASASMSRSYVAAPIVSGGRVVGLLHADRYAQGRDTDSHDRELLLSFSNALRLALSRARVVGQLEAAGNTLATLTESLAGAATGLREVSLNLSGTPPADGRGAGELHARPILVRSAPRAVPGDLTNRELQVLELMAEGRTNAAIARELVISDGTVKQHVKHILRKMHAANRAEAIALWFQAHSR